MNLAELSKYLDTDMFSYILLGLYAVNTVLKFSIGNHWQAIYWFGAIIVTAAVVWGMK